MRIAPSLTPLQPNSASRRGRLQCIDMGPFKVALRTERPSVAMEHLLLLLPAQEGSERGA